MKKLRQYLPLIIMLVIAAVVAALVFTGTVTVDELVAAADDNRALTVAVLAAIYIVKGLSLCIPLAPVAIAASQVFDPFPAIVINTCGTALCISISYCVGRFSKKMTLDSAYERFPKLAGYFRNAHENGFAFCFAVHSLHLSMEAQGVMFGLIRTKYADYLFSSMLALLPSMAWYTVLGERWDLADPRFWIFIGLDVIVILAGLCCFKAKIFKKDDK